MNKPHKKLNAWSDAVDIAQQVYRVTERFPSNEQFGLTSQIRRAAVSILSNIAEGAARQTKKEFLSFPYRKGLVKRIGHSTRDNKTPRIP